MKNTKFNFEWEIHTRNVINQSAANTQYNP